jgi:hypothetical protein
MCEDAVYAGRVVYANTIRESSLADMLGPRGGLWLPFVFVEKWGEVCE